MCVFHTTTKLTRHSFGPMYPKRGGCTRTEADCIRDGLPKSEKYLFPMPPGVLYGERAFRGCGGTEGTGGPSRDSVRSREARTRPRFKL
ncbi:hypothetical protein EVAR_71479_1 [Eumeta japonica]|uniref:Uncharacterized protein n=1 Tax=Eumeta variegata TaxID=151549 RepID=A0A4C1SG69_EUMVA|nr:hypothetical protein EVAR_71479_1 [Eumeta japonica]